MKLNQIPAPKGARHKPTRVGRGRGSGHGKTASYGQKGQKARSGGVKAPGFAGGQTRMAMRFPKRGFSNPRKRNYSIVNLEQLKDWPAGAEVNAKALFEKKVIADVGDGLRVLGDGEIKQALVFQACHFSQSARQKIEAAGGKALVVK